MSWCKQPEVGLPKPDSVLFLKLAPEIASKRADYGEERYEQRAFQDKVAQNYDDLVDSSWKVMTWLRTSFSNQTYLTEVSYLVRR